MASPALHSEEHKTRRLHVAFSHQEKLGFLHMVEAGHKQSTICNTHNIPRSTLATWIKNRESIQAAVEKGNCQGFRQRKTKNDSLDKALLEWSKLIRELDSNAELRGPMILEKANQLAAMYESQPVSRNWVDRWKKRYNIGGEYYIHDGANFRRQDCLYSPVLF